MLRRMTKEDGGCLLRRRCNIFSEGDIVAELFKLYEQMTKGSR